MIQRMEACTDRFPMNIPRLSGDHTLLGNGKVLVLEGLNHVFLFLMSEFMTNHGGLCPSANSMSRILAALGCLLPNESSRNEGHWGFPSSSQALSNSVRIRSRFRNGSATCLDTQLALRNSTLTLLANGQGAATGGFAQRPVLTAIFTIRRLVIWTRQVSKLPSGCHTAHCPCCPPESACRLVELVFRATQRPTDFAQRGHL